MDLLARREHAEGELVSKLLRTFGDKAELIESEIEKLRSEGLQSDARVAESYVRYQAGRGQGPVKIRAALRERGVADSLIAEAIDSVGIDWFELAAQVYRKRFGDSPPGDAKEKAKRSRFMQQRGFTYDQISSLP